MGFEWDTRKAALNLEKHGVGFEEAQTVFSDPFAAIVDDDAHSDDEKRELAIGHSRQGRLLFVSFVVRAEASQSVIRIISARRATRREQRAYEQR